MSEQKKDLSPAGPPCEPAKGSPLFKWLLHSFNFHTPFPISSLAGHHCTSLFHDGASNSPQSVRQDSVQTKPSYPLRSVQIGFARTCVLFYLQLTILCAEPPCCGRPCFVCWPGFVRFYQHHDVHRHFVSGATEKAEFLHWAQKRELIPSFLAGACFWAFIFGVLGRWTELWPRLGQARCVGVMAALPQPSLA